MIPRKLHSLILEIGHTESYAKGEVFHSQDFTNALFLLREGFVKRYQATDVKKPVIELIYGPDHIFPLSKLYNSLYHVDPNQRNLIYLYQAMTDVSLVRVPNDVIVSALEKDPELFMDLYFEAGLRLKSNIHRLATNALSDIHKKVAHLITFLAENFGSESQCAGTKTIIIQVPLTTKDVAEQINASVQETAAALRSLRERGILHVEGDNIHVSTLRKLKDVYL